MQVETKARFILKNLQQQQIFKCRIHFDAVDIKIFFERSDLQTVHKLRKFISNQ
jgi:hypothetical protein